ncbi:type I 3-dehydroquinate dehydratase [Candidatus Neptunochlamydia vexilliferae]|uniref:type I 3-dehydroquinate dehydratase n=1 Tax=Candidatus Neptunichlamydia vexilliferae TaxID=1651774 RepID=UPI0018916061|nr:type I 3-dehydroquinate dehydratase [Candidatus Neptunochlamydia vexilliferae]
MLVISLQGGLEEGRAAMRKKADAVEFRLDLMEKEAIAPLRKECPLPVIFTGGEYFDLEPGYVDIPYDSALKVPPGIKVIRSYHNFEETPENLEAILSEMEKLPAAIYKIATQAHSTLDALRMLTFVQGRKNVAGMCMGDKGAITRILGPVVGSPLTFAAPKKGKETAPGQLTVEELQGIYHFHKLGPKTKIFGLIGDPIDKSIGHLFHNDALAECDAVYVKMALKPEEVASFFEAIAPLPLYGLSVTMPLKERVGPGVFNTLTKKGNKWEGSNTDGKGALDVLEERGKVAGKTLLILGAGGSAKAIAAEGAARGAQILIANRTPEKGKALAQEVKGKFLSIEEVANCPYDILVNTTPVVPINPEIIHEGTVVLNIVLGETKLLGVKGCTTISGLEMFLSQGRKQLERWGFPQTDP